MRTGSRDRLPPSFDHHAAEHGLQSHIETTSTLLECSCQHSQSLEDISDEQLEETLQANIGGHFRMTRAALPHMGEMSPAHVFLAAPVCSSYINGVVLPAMGGPHG